MARVIRKKCVNHLHMRECYYGQHLPNTLHSIGVTIFSLYAFVWHLQQRQKLSEAAAATNLSLCLLFMSPSRKMRFPSRQKCLLKASCLSIRSIDFVIRFLSHSQVVRAWNYLAVGLLFKKVTCHTLHLRLRQLKWKIIWPLFFSCVFCQNWPSFHSRYDWRNEFTGQKQRESFSLY